LQTVPAFIPCLQLLLQVYVLRIFAKVFSWKKLWQKNISLLTGPTS
jgi:hypothetical protein